MKKVWKIIGFALPCGLSARRGRAFGAGTSRARQKTKSPPARPGEKAWFRLGQSHFLRTIIPAETAVHSTAMPMTAQKP